MQENVAVPAAGSAVGLLSMGSLGPLLLGLSVGALLLGSPGCGIGLKHLASERLSLGLMMDLRQGRPDAEGLLEDPEALEPSGRREGGGVASAILGTILAVVPGAIVPGLGHFYAGDSDTGRRLLRVGGFGLVLTGVGVGAGLGGYALDKKDLNGFAYSLYGAGGAVALIGSTYYLTAWFYDIIDTPRAVLSGGRPPPRSEFIDDLDLFAD